MRVQFKKRSDGSAVIQFFRTDGSTAGKRYEKHGVFFSHHDLTHFAVETVLGFERGFYGLIASGWDIADTDGKGSRGKPPLEALFVEHIVGLFSSENVGGNPPLTAAEFNRQLDEMVASKGVPIGRIFTEQELKTTRERIRDLHASWAAIPDGNSMELIFRLESRP